MPDFKIGYQAKKFNGIISMGVFNVEADSLETAKEQAFEMTKFHFENDVADEDEMWYQNCKSLSVEVTEIKEQ